MSRIKIDIPDNLLAEVSIPVRISDINYGNHVGNDAFISIIHEVRMQWLKQNNFTELNIAGTGLIMSNLSIDFKNESFYGDIIYVKLNVGEISRAGFDLYYQLSTKRNSEIILLANARTGMISYNYETGKIISIPAALKQILVSNKKR